jgi:L-ascorbate metabolism protein UlaG (beta-lactamase superfamily)
MSIHIQWLAHSAFMLDVDGHAVLIDPFVTGNPLATIEPSSLKPEVILLSHAHGDHLGDTVEIAKANSAQVITNFEVSQWLGEQGIGDSVGMNPGGTIDLGYMTVKCTRAYHSSSFPDGTYGGVPMGFLITAKKSDLVVYFAGDTDLFSDMSLIGEAGVDMAIVPIGDMFTMGIDDSLRAIQLLSPDFVMPMHYNTFPPITQDAGAWAERVNKETDATPVVLDPTSTYTLD